jgi:HSP20 family molecular chaperone IbpA
MLGDRRLSITGGTVEHDRVPEVDVHQRPDDGLILALDLAGLDDLDHIFAV